MKQGLLTSYIAGIKNNVHGEGFAKIFTYFVPEYITALLLYSVPILLDAYFISSATSTPEYATLGATNNLLHLLIKSAEAFSVGTVILTGRFNGQHAHNKVGESLRDSFWVTCIIGAFIASVLFFGASWIYKLYGVPQEIVKLGVPFLRIRAIGVFFTFIAMAFIGFLRGIKNTRTPMFIFVAGSVAFIACDYVLIFGKLGFSQWGLQGSAIASIVQYVTMCAVAFAVIAGKKKYREYSMHLLTVFTNQKHMRSLLRLSWPVLVDKATMACAYIWLCKMICPMGTCGLATFSVVKDMERFAFLPAVACAQIITFLVSNDMGLQNWNCIKVNIKKLVFTASVLVVVVLLVFSFYSEFIVEIFDKKGEFTGVASRAFPLLSVLVLFDVLQLVLAGALRGAGNVRVVMLVRLAVVLLYFIPVSYLLSQWPMESMVLKFVLIYGAFYLGNGIMSFWYIYQFRSGKWKTHAVK